MRHPEREAQSAVVAWRRPLIAAVASTPTGLPTYSPSVTPAASASPTAEAPTRAASPPWMVPRAPRRGWRCPGSAGPWIPADHQPVNPAALMPMWFLDHGRRRQYRLRTPSEKVPSSALRLVRPWADAGLPEGVATVLHGDLGAV